MTQQGKKRIEARKPIAIVRLDDLEEAVQIARALYEGGITTLEFTLTNQHAFKAIEKVQKELAGAVLLGAGTVLDAENAQASIQAGARFLVTPAFLPDVIAVGRGQNIPVICGAFTPTEIVAAWRAGANFVKVFPVAQLGPSYIKDILAPLPTLPLIPTGGVNLENCAAFLAAGAYTVAVGSQLIGKELVARKDWAALKVLASKYEQQCHQAL